MCARGHNPFHTRDYKLGRPFLTGAFTNGIKVRVLLECRNVPLTSRCEKPGSIGVFLVDQYFASLYCVGSNIMQVLCATTCEFCLKLIGGL